MSVMRTYLWTVGHETLLVAHHDVWWMSWNLLLAAVPAVMAVLLFHHPHRRTPLWWAGVVAFVLFLPNAPYVVTDLIHVRHNVRTATVHGTVVFGILPMYVAFIAAGFAFYALSLYEVGRAVARSRWSPQSRLVQFGLHATCAVGVLIGRVPHINSWSVLTQPKLSLSLSAHTLSNPAAPLVILVLFGVIWLGHASTTAVAHTAYRSWLHVRAVSPRTNVR